MNTYRTQPWTVIGLILALIILALMVRAPARATTTVTKNLVVQTPVYDQAGVVVSWTDGQAFPYSTPEERAAMIGTARDAAKAAFGRLVQITVTVDNHDTTDETLWDTTTALKVILVRAVPAVSVTLPNDMWKGILDVLVSQGQAWSESAVKAIREATGLSTAKPAG